METWIKVVIAFAAGALITYVALTRMGQSAAPSP